MQHSETLILIFLFCFSWSQWLQTSWNLFHFKTLYTFVWHEICNSNDSCHITRSSTTNENQLYSILFVSSSVSTLLFSYCIFGPKLTQTSSSSLTAFWDCFYVFLILRRPFWVFLKAFSFFMPFKFKTSCANILIAHRKRILEYIRLFPWTDFVSERLEVMFLWTFCCLKIIGTLASRIGIPTLEGM